MAKVQVTPAQKTALEYLYTNGAKAFNRFHGSREEIPFDKLSDKELAIERRRADGMREYVLTEAGRELANQLFGGNEPVDPAPVDPQPTVTSEPVASESPAAPKSANDTESPVARFQVFSMVIDCDPMSFDDETDVIEHLREYADEGENLRDYLVVEHTLARTFWLQNLVESINAETWLEEHDSEPAPDDSDSPTILTDAMLAEDSDDFTIPRCAECKERLLRDGTCGTCGAPDDSAIPFATWDEGAHAAIHADFVREQYARADAEDLAELNPAIPTTDGMENVIVIDSPAVKVTALGVPSDDTWVVSYHAPTGKHVPMQLISGGHMTQAYAQAKADAWNAHRGGNLWSYERFEELGDLSDAMWDLYRLGQGAMPKTTYMYSLGTDVISGHGRTSRNRRKNAPQSSYTRRSAAKQGRKVSTVTMERNAAKQAKIRAKYASEYPLRIVERESKSERKHSAMFQQARMVAGLTMLNYFFGSRDEAA